MGTPTLEELKAYLDSLVVRFEQPTFIADDPISIPHGFDDPRDQEVIGLYAALLAWGQRKTILNKMADLCERMQYRPYRFVRDFHPARDAEKLAGFKHRTFQPVDARWFTRNLGAALRQHDTVENLFATKLAEDEETIETAIQGFSEGLMAMSPETPRRLQKHLARPATGSACKRLNMYLRWMVRSGPVDLGIWTKIRPDQLVLPLDVHAGRQARALGMVARNQNDWRAALELTAHCCLLCPDDPARYDFAFFGVGAYDEALDPRFTGANTLTFASSPTER